MRIFRREDSEVADLVRAYVLFINASTPENGSSVRLMVERFRSHGVENDLLEELMDIAPNSLEILMRSVEESLGMDPIGIRLAEQTL